MHAQRLAIQLMVAQAVLFSAETMVIHHLGSRVSVVLLALIRGFGGVVLAFAVARHIGFAVMRTRQPLVQLLRGGVSLLYLWVMLYSFSHLPFADATAISFTQAVYIPAFAVLILGESVPWSRWAAAAVGLAGALLVAKPGFAGWNSVYLVALLGAAFNGLAFVLNRYLQREDSEATTMFYTNAILVLGNVPAFAAIAAPAPETAGALCALFVLGPVGMLAGIVALRHANAAALGPFTLLRLVIGVTGGVIIFHEMPDALSIIGATLILGSCLLASRAQSVFPAGATSLAFSPRRLFALAGSLPLRKGV